ncbi:APC family permease [Altibacter sp.]|uniref:APC family permease n=1 Tax=Altibacter sp. TaxID=2024823 RepID=UPI00258909E8|nr:APC family permease [Altibacter sp.]MCW9037814.1 APC family permease [Altibacter sp.]
MSATKLKRTMGLTTATSIGLGAMLGAGIFVFPGLAGGKAGFAATISFFIGGVIALLVAVCTAELATAMPQSGGGYFFISRAFDKFWGTLTGIAQWVGLIFACAFYLVSFGEYALTFLEEINIRWNSSTKIVSFLFTLLLLAINILGTKKVGRFQNFMVILLTIILVLIFTYGLIDFLGWEAETAAFSENTPNGLRSIFTTTALIFTSYLGFVQIANIGAEVKNPNKNLPRSLIWSVLIAMSLYIFIMIVCTVTLPQAELQKFGETATIEVARKMLGHWGAIIVVFAGLLAALSSANASMTSASRGVFALSNDKVISKAASNINKTFGTPHIALILVAVPVSVMLLRSNLEVFAEVASFLHLIIYSGICLSVLKLRMTQPTWYIPTFRVPAVKVVAGLGALSCLGVLFFMQKESILISVVVLLGASAYYFLYVKNKEITLYHPRPPHVDKDFFNPSILVPVNVDREKKELPHAILKALPISRLLLLGYKEIPEQSDSKQSEEQFGKEAEQKLGSIQEELEEANINYESKLIFSHDMLSQIKHVIEEEKLEFILTLKSASELSQIVVPIYDQSQINTQLSTILYNLHERTPVKIKVLLFIEPEGGSANELRLKQAVEKQLGLVNLSVSDYNVYKAEKVAPKEMVKQLPENSDLILWSEALDSERDFLYHFLLEKKSLQVASPSIIILKREGE